ncbi:S-layer homology domain-containing protein [Candidatus Atelocyanobacterium thalassae]|uniref:SLH domain-containing protein n=1 Tax=cyanobacterium endosymbiont of Braarudosphaera bigelowii TaxID=1285375 RepID=A0ABN6K0Y9_9CHRO|nr:S-layer homology domain-containing protein [Candidatus Atelocyanobacterium thalassa]BDA39683.1 hypothetical protein CPARK_000052300 [cyanobacterium endosymbiont of Braarudosphaera bigelowii]
MNFEKYIFSRKLLISVLFFTLNACNSNSFLETRFFPSTKLGEKIESQLLSKYKFFTYYPSIIPQYPNSYIEKIPEALTDDKGIIFFLSDDSIETISDFYNQQFKSDSWEIVKFFSKEDKSFIARKKGLEVELIFLSHDTTTNYFITYKSTRISVTEEVKKNYDNEVGKFKNIPEVLYSYVNDLVALGTLDLENINKNSQSLDINTEINRRTYAKWIFKTYNKFYQDIPEKQIRPVTFNSKPVFSDVPMNDPDYFFIQGLAEAGIISSSLSGDNNSLLFYPNAYLTREDLIVWKTPLDLGRGLPIISSIHTEKTWGFEDIVTIKTKARQALYVDFHNKDKSNVRRIFGYITLFQPKKPVTLAEAITSLWYFGYQEKGFSAYDILQKQKI